METSTNKSPTIRERLQSFWSWAKQTWEKLYRKHPNLSGILEKFFELLMALFLIFLMFAIGAFLFWLPTEYGWTGGIIAVVLAALIWAVIDHYR